MLNASQPLLSTRLAVHGDFAAVRKRDPHVKLVSAFAALAMTSTTQI